MNECSCCCSTVGAPQEIRLCSIHHKYWWSDKELVSVSRVIDAVYPRKTWDDVAPAIVDYARIRGSYVDDGLCQYINTGNVRLDVPELVNPSNGDKLPDEVRHRLGNVIQWWDKSGLTAVSTQMIVFSVQDGIAGTLDLIVTNGDGERCVADLKCVSELQKSYKIQIGAYLYYANAEKSGIIHATKNKVQWIPYDAAKCRNSWLKCKEWWLEMKAL